MPKTATLFSCLKCGAQTPKWAGRCPECGGWGTLEEERTPTSRSTEKKGVPLPAGKVQAFADLPASLQTRDRLKTLFPFWDRLLGGGFVPGSVTLIGGEPGIGKSTLLAQLCLALAQTGKTVLYVTGEESPSQVALRLRRLAPTLPPTLLFLDQTDAETIAATLEKEKPTLAVVDSIQSFRLSSVPGEAGNPSQIRACGATLSEVAKHVHVTLILVGQVTKEGDLAGPRLLEHLVDTVFMMEGDRAHAWRVLRTQKHRFGATDETAILEMSERGLEEVKDPSALLLEQRHGETSGSAITCLVEGSRATLLEIQALVTPAGYGVPARRISGVDLNRVNLLLAVLGKRARIAFGDQDVIVNAAGGLNAKDAAHDLAMALALVSAKHDRALPPKLVAFAEVGLGGELRPVPHVELRLKEAARLGFTQAIVAKSKSLDKISIKNLELLPAEDVQEALRFAKLTS